MDLSRFKLVEEARQISKIVWEEVILWKIFEKDTVGKQLVRAADSITANLSEAFGRYSYADRKRFGYYARGSLTETITWLNLSVERGLIDSEKGEDLISKLLMMSKKLNAYINHCK